MVQSMNLYDNQGNKEVLRSLPITAKKIIDLGCGAGNIGRDSIQTGIIWDGITLSRDEAEVAKKYYRKVILFNLENGLPLDQIDCDYDVCICSHVIEHIVWPEKLLSDIRILLTHTNGLLIMAIPNALNHEIRMKFLRGKFEYKQSGILDINHVRWYTFKTARDLLIKNNFTVNRAWADGTFPLGKRIRKKLPSSFLNFVDKLSCKYFPGFFGFHLLYTATPNKYLTK